MARVLLVVANNSLLLQDLNVYLTIVLFRC